DIVISNHDQDAMDLEVSVSVGADFADLFEVKDKLEKKGTSYVNMTGSALTLGYKRDTFVRETRITADKQAEIRKDGLLFRVHLAPRSEWTVGIDVAAIGRVDREGEGNGNGHAAALSPAALDKDVEDW